MMTKEGHSTRATSGIQVLKQRTIQTGAPGHGRRMQAVMHNTAIEIPADYHDGAAGEADD